MKSLLKAELQILRNRLDVGRKGEKMIKDESQIYGMRSWEEGDVTN